MRNAQLEYRVAQVDDISPLSEMLSLLKKMKARGGLQFTEIFETEELAAYLEMVEYVDEYTNICGTERYPGMMLGPYYENVILPDNIFDLLKAYYHDVYGSQQQINPTIVQFGRLRLGSDIYGATIAPRYENRSFIRAKFLGQTDNTVDIYPGKVQFFFQHVAMVNNRPKTHHLAYVR